MIEAEEACRCKHCGRCVLAGPPCCYDKVYQMYQEVTSERDWLRKIQSKKDKQINGLKKRLEELLYPGV
jgi:gamma-glutamyl:cysteine ligase YbdK (ATP-grasp superfamily)